MATCENGHEHELDVRLDIGPVLWECPNCQARAVVPGTEPIDVAVPETIEGVHQVRDGDAGRGGDLT